MNTATKRGPQLIYGVFYTPPNATPQWALSRNKRKSLTFAKLHHAIVGSIPLTSGRGPWDAPTFRALMDPIADYRLHTEGEK